MGKTAPPWTVHLLLIRPVVQFWIAGGAFLARALPGGGRLKWFVLGLPVGLMTVGGRGECVVGVR